MNKQTTIRYKCGCFVRLYKFGNKHVLLPNLYFYPMYCRLQIISVITVFAVQKKESPNVKCDRWTLLKLYNKNFILINRDFFAVGQLNKPFSTIVINDDAVAVTFPWE